MHKIIVELHNQGIPVASAVKAAQHLGGYSYPASEYETLFKIVADKDVSFADDDTARMTFSYFVAEAINASDHTDKLDADTMLETAKTKADKLIKENPWMFAKPEAEPKLDDNGKPKPKKGAKKELAKKVYAEHIEGKDLSRKEAIEILVKEVGLTPAGASTYYANLKKGVL